MDLNVQVTGGATIGSGESLTFESNSLLVNNPGGNPDIHHARSALSRELDSGRLTLHRIAEGNLKLGFDVAASLLATTTGIVVPVPSVVDRSTSNLEVTSDRPGTMKTSL